MRAGVNECRQKARACCKREETKRFALIFMGQKRQMRLTSVWCQRVVNTLLAPQMCKQINSPPSHAAMHSWSAKTLSPLVLEQKKRHLVCRSILSFAEFVCRRKCSMCQGGTSQWPYTTSVCPCGSTRRKAVKVGKVDCYVFNLWQKCFTHIK